MGFAYAHRTSTMLTLINNKADEKKKHGFSLTSIEGIYNIAIA